MPQFKQHFEEIRNEYNGGLTLAFNLVSSKKKMEKDIK